MEVKKKGGSQNSSPTDPHPFLQSTISSSFLSFLRLFSSFLLCFLPLFHTFTNCETISFNKEMNVITTMSSQRTFPSVSNLGPIRRPKPSSTVSSSIDTNTMKTTTTNTNLGSLIGNPTANYSDINYNSNGTIQPNTTINTNANTFITSSITSSSSASDINFMKDFLNLLRDLNTKLSKVINPTNDFPNVIIERNMIIDVCSLLKIYGSSIDNNSGFSGSNFSEFKSLLDSFFTQLIHLIDTNQLDIVTRGHVLHVFELRNNRWQAKSVAAPIVTTPVTSALGQKHVNTGAISKSFQSYAPGSSDPNHGAVDGYNQQVQQWQQQVFGQSASNQQIPSPTSSDEKVKDNRNIGSHNNSNQHYLKGELLIRNSDSGKVMGVKGRRVRMIEELSDTIISFQKVNKDDRDRRLQITGSNQLGIETAKRLIVDTIRRNASPVPPAGSDDVDLTFADAYSLPAIMNPFSSHQASGGLYSTQAMSGQQQQQFGFEPLVPLESAFRKGLQKSSSLGITLKPKADGLFSSTLRPCIYDSDDVIYMSSNNSLLLNEAVQVLTVHLDQRRKQVDQRNTLINSNLINNNNCSLIKQQMQLQQQIHQQMLKKKRINLLSGPPGVGTVGNIGTGIGTTRLGSNSYDDLIRPTMRTHFNLEEEDEEEIVPTSTGGSYKYFGELPGVDTSDKPGLNRIKSVLSSSISGESQTSPLFGDFLHRDSFDLAANVASKSGMAQIKAIKKSASSNTLYSRQSSNNLTSTPLVNVDDPLINLETSSPWTRVSPMEPLTIKRTIQVEPMVSKVVAEKEVAKEGEVSDKASMEPKPVDTNKPTTEPIVSYNKMTLLQLSKSDLSRGLPNEYESMKTLLPDIMI